MRKDNRHPDQVSRGPKNTFGQEDRPLAECGSRIRGSKSDRRVGSSHQLGIPIRLYNVDSFYIL